MTRDFGELLKNARKEKNLSQQELAKRVGMPQSHISNIENGRVDLQTSSLVEIARILDLELMLVPRTLIRTVQALQRNENVSEPRPMYRLDEEENEE